MAVAQESRHFFIYHRPIDGDGGRRGISSSSSLDWRLSREQMRTSSSRRRLFAAVQSGTETKGKRTLLLYYNKCLKFDSFRIESSRVVTCHSGGGGGGVVVIPRADATCNIQPGTGGCCTASVRPSVRLKTSNKQHSMYMRNVRVFIIPPGCCCCCCALC